MRFTYPVNLSLCLRDMGKFIKSNFSGECTVLAVFIVVQVSGCAPATKVTQADGLTITQETGTKHESIPEELRHLDLLNRVAWPIRANNAGLCKEHVKESYGLTLIKRETIPKNNRATWQKVFDSKGRVFVLNVVEGSPAWHSGLRRGDTILKDYENKGYRILQFRRIKDKREVMIKPLPICEYNIEYRDDDTLNAFTDGKNIYITKGLIQFVDNNTELATVIAHELAHNIEWNCQQRVGSYFPIIPTTVRTATNKRLLEIIKKIFEKVFIGAVTNEIQDRLFDIHSPNSNKYCESEADYIGLYLLARAGFNTADAVIFWKRLIGKKPKIIEYAKTHPTPEERVTRLVETHREIQQKLKIHSKTSLIPERKSYLRY